MLGRRPRGFSGWGKETDKGCPQAGRGRGLGGGSARGVRERSCRGVESAAGDLGTSGSGFRKPPPQEADQASRQKPPIPHPPSPCSTPAASAGRKQGGAAARCRVRRQGRGCRGRPLPGRAHSWGLPHRARARAGSDPQCWVLDPSFPRAARLQGALADPNSPRPQEALSSASPAHAPPLASQSWGRLGLVHLHQATHPRRRKERIPSRLRAPLPLGTGGRLPGWSSVSRPGPLG